MSELHQIAAGADTAMTRNHRTDSPIYKFDEKVNEGDMYSRMSLKKRLQAR